MNERRGRLRYDFRPLTMTWAEVSATVFRRSESWLRDHMPADFPKPDPTYGVFATEAVEAWVRRRFDLASPNEGTDDAEARLLGKLQRGQDQNPPPRRSAA